MQIKRRKPYICFILFLVVVQIFHTTAGAAWISLGSNEAGENEQPAAADPVVDVITETADGQSVIYTGLLSGYENGAWADFEIGTSQMVSVFDWNSDVPAKYIIPVCADDGQDDALMRFDTRSLRGIRFSDAAGEYSAEILLKNGAEEVQALADAASVSVVLTNNSSIPKRMKVYAAVYDIDMALKSITESITAEAAAGASAGAAAVIENDSITETDTVKVFVWDPDNMSPYIRAQIYYRGGEDFDIYEYDCDILRYRNKLEAEAELMEETDEEEARRMRVACEDIVCELAMLYSLPQEIEEYTGADRETLVKDYYKTKYPQFMRIKNRLRELAGEIPGSEAEQYDNSIFYEYIGSDEAAPMAVNGSGAGLMSINTQSPTLSISNIGTNGFSYTAAFPDANDENNRVEIIDFTNAGGNVSINHITSTDGGSITRSITTAPGSFYIIGALNSHGRIYKRVQVQYNNDESREERAGRHVIADMESADIQTAGDKFDIWLERMDSVYEALADLTGYIPYNGKKIRLMATRDDLYDEYEQLMGITMPDGLPSWEVLYGFSGQTVKMSEPFVKSHMRRLNVSNIDDWGDLPIHELSHDFDTVRWGFDYEAMAFLKMYCVMKSLNATVFRTDVATYSHSSGSYHARYTGDEYYNFLLSDYYKGYSGYFNRQHYSSGGMAAVLIKCVEYAGIEALKKTFRYMNGISEENVPASDIGKLNLFLTKLKDYSGKDVLSKITYPERVTVNNEFSENNIDLAYCNAPVYPVPEPAGTLHKDIDVSFRSGIELSFTAQQSGIYSIYTSTYGNNGIANRTRIDVYDNAAFSGSPAVSNYSFGSSELSKVTLAVTQGKTYYVKLYTENGDKLHTSIHITPYTPAQSLELYEKKTASIQAGDCLLYGFTPAENDLYSFGAEGGYIKLYKNDDLSGVIDYGEKLIVHELTAGSTYYLMYSGPGMVAASGSVRANKAQQVRFQKRTDSSMIFVNSPEYITRYDILDDSDANIDGFDFDKRRKIFEQENVTGKNTYYESHNAWLPDDNRYAYTYPLNDFYYDIDFYNPSDSPVTIYANNIVCGTNHTGLESAWGNYYTGGASVTLTVNPGQHRLLFEALGGSVCCNDPTQNNIYSRWARTLGAFFDFEVIGGNVTVSSIAAYNSADLHLKNGTSDIVNIGGTDIYLDHGNVIPAEDRRSESDIAHKQKGFAENQGGWVDSDIDLIVDDITNGAIGLRFYDGYYPQGMHGQYYWQTSANPLQDNFSILHLLPGSLHSYTYNGSEHGDGRLFRYDKEHKIIKNANLDISGNPGDPVNQAIESSIVSALKENVSNGTNPYTSAPCADAFSLGEYGTTYHYTISAVNKGRMPKKIIYQVANTKALVLGMKKQEDSTYQIYNTSNYKDLGYEEWFPCGAETEPASLPENIKGITVQPGETVIYEVVTTLVPGADGGTYERIYVE